MSKLGVIATAVCFTVLMLNVAFLHHRVSRLESAVRMNADSLRMNAEWSVKNAKTDIAQQQDIDRLVGRGSYSVLLAPERLSDMPTFTTPTYEFTDSDGKMWKFDEGDSP